MSKSLDYLDLELKKAKKRVSLDNVAYYCFHNTQEYHHRFHNPGEPQLNLLCDNSFSLLQNFLVLSRLHQKLHEDLTQGLEVVLKHLRETNTKLEFLKHQKQSLPSPSQTALTRLEKIEKTLEDLTSLIKKNIGNE